MKKTIHGGEELTYRGRRVRVLDIDSDPRTAVWIAFCDEPDEDAMVDRTELN